MKHTKDWLSACYFVVFVAFAFSLWGCLGVRYLAEDEKILAQQRIWADKQSIASQARKLIAKKPNKRFLWLPIALEAIIYEEGKKLFSPRRYEYKMAYLRTLTKQKIAIAAPKKKERLLKKQERKLSRWQEKLAEGNFWMQVGHPLARYDKEAAQRNVHLMKQHLQKTGHFDGSVHVEKKEHHQKVKETYHIQAGEVYLFDTLHYVVEDDFVQSVLEAGRLLSPIKKGRAYHYEHLVAEKEHIRKRMHNKGFFSFQAADVSFVVDTAAVAGNWLALEAKLTPSSPQSFQRYQTGKVSYHIQDPVHRKNQSFLYKDLYVNSEHYYPKILYEKNILQPGDWYNEESLQKTKQRLYSTKIFRFISIEQARTKEDNVEITLFLHPKKRYEFSPSFGFSTSSELPSPFLDLSITARNLSHKLETIRMSTRFTLRGISTPSQADLALYRGYQQQFNLVIDYPSLLVPFANNLALSTSFLPLASKRSTSIAAIKKQYNTHTRIEVGVHLDDRIEYSYKSYSLTYGIRLDTEKKWSYAIDLLDVTLIRSVVDNQFWQAIRPYGFSLLNAFSSSFISSASMRVSHNNAYDQPHTEGSFFQLSLENGGNALWLYRPLLDNAGLSAHQFIRLYTEYKKYHTLSWLSAFYWRLRAGIALPYTTKQSLPYQRFFFVGGNNSVRAWRSRRLGQGAFSTRVNNTSPYFGIERPGEIVYEGNVEYRKKLNKVVELASFIDSGNVWMARENFEVQGVTFKLDNFYKEIAVGMGVGVRLDVSYLILRFDTAVKVYDPAQALGRRFVLDDIIARSRVEEPILYTLAIGYPF